MDGWEYQPERTERKSTKLEDNLEKLPKNAILRKKGIKCIKNKIEKKVKFDFCQTRVQERGKTPTCPLLNSSTSNSLLRGPV